MALRALATLLLALVFAAPCVAQTGAKDDRVKRERSQRPGEIAVGVGHGIGFLPMFIAQDLGIFDKHARASGLGGKIVVRRFSTAAPMRQALAMGEIAAGPYGIPAFLIARDAIKQGGQDLRVVSGITTLPLVLVTARPDIRGLDNIKPADKIAVPMLTAPQVMYLRMRANPIVGGPDRVRQQLIEMPHQDALEALSDRKGIAAYFSSPPFTQIALRDPKVRAVTSSAEIMGGKTSFLVMAAPKSATDAHPKLAEVLAKSIEEASSIIRKNPRRAAMVWLKWEPSQTLDARAVEGILGDLKDDFGSAVFGVEGTAAYLRRDGRLKDNVRSWKDVVAPAIAAGEGS
jgi:NitT/TauT family transport system substrate-binding protein